jgi:hypothetical protein
LVEISGIANYQTSEHQDSNMSRLVGHSIAATIGGNIVHCSDA